jgi:hypothetical protein
VPDRSAVEEITDPQLQQIVRRVVGRCVTDRRRRP